MVPTELELDSPQNSEFFDLISGLPPPSVRVVDGDAEEDSEIWKEALQRPPRETLELPKQMMKLASTRICEERNNARNTYALAEYLKPRGDQIMREFLNLAPGHTTKHIDSLIRANAWDCLLGEQFLEKLDRSTIRRVGVGSFGIVASAMVETLSGSDLHRDKVCLVSIFGGPKVVEFFMEPPKTPKRAIKVMLSPYNSETTAAYTESFNGITYDHIFTELSRRDGASRPLFLHRLGVNSIPPTPRELFAQFACDDIDLIPKVTGFFVFPLDPTVPSSPGKREFGTVIISEWAYNNLDPADIEGLLSDYLVPEKLNDLSLNHRMIWATQVLDAVSRMHAKGVAHGDIFKNMLVSHFKVKLIDMSLAVEHHGSNDPPYNRKVGFPNHTHDPPGYNHKRESPYAMDLWHCGLILYLLFGFMFESIEDALPAPAGSFDPNLAKRHPSVQSTPSVDKG
ncbi:hypothetical protein HDU93_001596 [Gonapodya sp. JEL0774]|nr:hypothetical protein HDU93_001596 [Gonapodya sp. JEL0774]